MIKPSEFAPATSRVWATFFDKYLDKRYYRCIQGAVKTGIKISSVPFDMLCFTGSTFTGKLIAKAASENLTPLILELGGKCPTIVDRTANIQLAARRIASTKFTNCGQTCVAPDYVFVHRQIQNAFIQELKSQVEKQFGRDAKTNFNYSRLIHTYHTERTQSLMAGHEDKIIAKYGELDIQDKFFPPTILLEPDMNSKLMKEEIFGPILPIYPYETPMDVIKIIQNNPHPLTVYYYGEKDSIVRQRLEENTRSGSFVVND